MRITISAIILCVLSSSAAAEQAIHWVEFELVSLKDRSEVLTGSVGVQYYVEDPNIDGWTTLADDIVVPRTRHGAVKFYGVDPQRCHDKTGTFRALGIHTWTGQFLDGNGKAVTATADMYGGVNVGALPDLDRLGVLVRINKYGADACTDANLEKWGQQPSMTRVEWFNERRGERILEWREWAPPEDFFASCKDLAGSDEAIMKTCE